MTPWVPQLVLRSLYAPSGGYDSLHSLPGDASLEEEMLLLHSSTNSDISEKNGQSSSRAAPSHNPLRSTIAALALVLCGALLGSIASAAPWDALSAHTARGAEICNPYNSHGRLNVSLVANETKWIPIREREDCPVVDWMGRLHAAATITTDEEVDHSIDFARGKTVLLVGDSVDRGHITHLCEQLSGVLTMIGSDHPLSPAYPNSEETWPSNDQSRPYYCYVAPLDFLILNTFEFGFKEEDDWLRVHGHYYPPARIEDRIDSISVPLLEALGRELNRSTTPDLVSLTATLWGVLRAAKDDQASIDSALASGASFEEADRQFHKWRPMPDHLASWYASRAEEVIRHVGSLWSHAPRRPRLLWRSLHRTRLWEDIPAVRVAAMNQITQQVVQSLVEQARAARAGASAWEKWTRLLSRVHSPAREAKRNSHGQELNARALDLDQRLFVNSWADKIDGVQYREELFLDQIHPGPSLSYLYANILLHELWAAELLRSQRAQESSAARRSDPKELEKLP